MTWRPMREDDLASVATIERIVHPQFPPEGVEIMGERLRLWPRGCTVLEIDGQPRGYLIGFPWQAAAPPPLGRLLGALHGRPDTYYVHDLALLPEARGRGHAGPAVLALLALAESIGLAHQSLVAVHRSDPFWQRFGFVAEIEPALAAKLQSFGPGARYMVRRSGTGG